MKYCRFELDGTAHYGLLESVAGREMITRIFTGASDEAPLPDEDGPSKKISPVALDEASLLAPARPSKVVCIGRNYREHAAEFGNPVPTELMIFLKPPTSILDPGAAIRRPAKLSERVDYEGELAIIIGQECRKLAADQDVREFIRGYSCLNDVTARDLQRKDGQWTRGKGFDTFCPVGPLVTDEVDPWAGLEVETRVNGAVKQHGTTTDLVFPVDAIIRFISNVMTLLPGDLIATGTPEGVGPIVAGDTVEVSVSGIGTLSNPVVDD